MSDTDTAAAPVTTPHQPARPPLMRAARLHKTGEPFMVDQVARPTPRSRDVLVQVKSCGVVPNLINVLRHIEGHHLHRPPLPAIYGLDAAGVVVETGSLVHGIEVGDRVYVNPLRYCGSCRSCRAGRVEACDHSVLNGYFGLGAKSEEMFNDYPYGGYAEYMTAPQDSLVKLPENVSFDVAARWGYLGTAYKALRRANVDMSKTVLINGISGTLGLGAALFALALGAPKIMGTGRNVELLERVKALAPGRIHVHSVGGGESVAAWVRSLTDGAGADVVIDALPTNAPPASFLEAMAALARGGTHVNIGGVVLDVPINFINLISNTQDLLSSLWFTTKDGQEMADLAGSGCANLGVFEHEAFALDQINEALATIGGRHGGFSNYVVHP